MLRTQKLRKVSPDELLVRSSQLLAQLAERQGWSSLAKLPTDESLFGMLRPRLNGGELSSAQELLRSFQARSEPKFFPAFTDREATVREFKERWPDAASKIIECANSIIAGRFDLLGFRSLSFGDPIDWHLEPVSGKRTPLVHWSRLDFLDAEVAGDKKIIWELNRHQYFVKLGQAYWLTGDEKFAQTFVAHLDSWMDENPPKLGINWASSLEVAFRSVSWLWAFYFFKDSPALSPKTFLRAWKFLYLNARHLETYLSTYFSPNTHLTGEALGLFYLGTLLPEFSEADHWRTTGLRILTEQLSRHVKPDGVYFEQSSYYHRYTTEFYMHLFILMRANGKAVPDELERKLKALLDHLMYITRPDGTTPFFGDDDGGRLVILDRRVANDFRGTLTTGAALFKRGDYKYVADGVSQETLWLLGSSALRELDLVEPRQPSQQSVAFEDGGYYVMRDGWTRTSNYLWFDCGPHGTLNCGHAHADTLSFELTARGRPILVDPGTYTYTGSKKMRDWFRSSAAHNTLTIDGQSSSVCGGPFSWKTVASSERLNWISRERFDFVKGRHDGYSRLQQPVAHTRSILFLKRNYWIIRDQVWSDGDHQADLWFHFDPGSDPLIEALNQTTVVSDQDEAGGLDMYVFADEGRWRREDGWVSHCYGEKTPARVYAFSAPAKGDFELLTFLLPQLAAPGGKHSVREIEAVGGKAFEIVHEEGLDVVMIGPNRIGVRVETERLASDFEWTWVRFSNREDPTPEDVLLIGGQSLLLDGREILKLRERVGYLAAHHSGNKLSVETDTDESHGLRVSDFETANSQPEIRE